MTKRLKKIANFNKEEKAMLFNLNMIGFILVDDYVEGSVIHKCIACSSITYGWYCLYPENIFDYSFHEHVCSAGCAFEKAKTK